jgi:hypothetical protein
VIFSGATVAIIRRIPRGFTGRITSSVAPPDAVAVLGVAELPPAAVAVPGVAEPPPGAVAEPGVADLPPAAVAELGVNCPNLSFRDISFSSWMENIQEGPGKTVLF